MIFLLALLAGPALLEAQKPVCSNNFVVDMVPSLGINFRAIGTCTATYAIPGANDGSQTSCSCLNNFSRSDIATYDCYQDATDTYTFAEQWGICQGNAPPALPTPSTCPCTYSSCSAMYANCQTYVANGAYMDEGTCVGDVFGKGITAMFGGPAFDFDGTLDQCCLDSVLALDPNNGMGVTCPFDDSMCTDTIADCNGMMMTCGMLPTQTGQDKCFGDAIWDGTASNCCQIYMIKQGQAQGGNLPQCTQAESMQAMSMVTDPTALAACTAWSMGTPGMECACMAGVSQSVAEDLSHCSADGGSVSFEDLWWDCTGGGGGGSGCSGWNHPKPVGTQAEKDQLLMDAQRLARGGDMGAQVCVDLIMGNSSGDDRDGCICLGALSAAGLTYDWRWDPCDEETLLDSATFCDAAMGCADDPNGYVAADISKDCSNVGYDQGWGWSCEQYDHDFNGVSTYIWELCPSSCQACVEYATAEAEAEAEAEYYPESEPEGSGCANDGSPVCTIVEQTTLIQEATRIAQNGLTQEERDGAAICLQLASGTSTAQTDGCTCLMALPDAVLGAANCRWGVCDRYNMLTEKQECLARVACSDDPNGYLAKDPMGRTCDTMASDWTGTGGWACDTYDMDFNGWGIALSYYELCPQSCHACTYVEPEPEYACDANCGNSLMDCAQELQDCTDAINQGQYIGDSFTCLGDIFGAEMNSPGSQMISSCCMDYIMQSEGYVAHTCPVNMDKCDMPGTVGPADCSREESWCLSAGSPPNCMHDLMAAGKVSHCCMAYTEYTENNPVTCDPAALAAGAATMTNTAAQGACMLWMGGDLTQACNCMSGVDHAFASQYDYCSPDGGPDTFYDIYNDCNNAGGLPLCTDTMGTQYATAWGTLSDPTAIAACTAWGAGATGQECTCIAGMDAAAAQQFTMCSIDGGATSFTDLHDYCVMMGGMKQCDIAEMTKVVQGMGDLAAQAACTTWMSGAATSGAGVCNCMSGIDYSAAQQFYDCSADGGPVSFLDTWHQCGGQPPMWPKCSDHVAKWDKELLKLVKGDAAATAACTDVTNGNYSNLCDCFGAIKLDKAKIFECSIDPAAFPETTLLMQVAECTVGKYAKPESTGNQIYVDSVGYLTQAECEAGLVAGPGGTPDPSYGAPVWSDTNIPYYENLCTNEFYGYNANDGYREDSYYASCDAQPGVVEVTEYDKWGCKKKDMTTVETTVALTCMLEPDSGYYYYIDMRGGNCDSANMCCQANTLACLACQAGVSEKKYCKKNKASALCIKCKKLKTQTDCDNVPTCQWKQKNAKKGKCKDAKAPAPATTPKPVAAPAPTPKPTKKKGGGGGKKPTVSCSGFTSKQKCEKASCTWKRGNCS